ncbi:hypothetical protein MXD81_16975, partial [Microbacteriaceae bacterium K1510]|nr:hypothetical protein [Microbacteriaceae bacterium K1510]
NLRTESGVIVNLTIRKESGKRAYVSSVSYLPTWTQRRNTDGEKRFRVIPVRKFIRRPDARVSASDLKTLKQVWQDTTSHLKGRPV